MNGVGIVAREWMLKWGLVALCAALVANAIGFLLQAQLPNPDATLQTIIRGSDERLAAANQQYLERLSGSQIGLSHRDIRTKGDVQAALRLVRHQREAFVSYRMALDANAAEIRRQLREHELTPAPARELDQYLERQFPSESPDHRFLNAAIAYSDAAEAVLLFLERSTWTFAGGERAFASAAATAEFLQLYQQEEAAYTALEAARAASLEPCVWRSGAGLVCGGRSHSAPM